MDRLDLLDVIAEFDRLARSELILGSMTRAFGRFGMNAVLVTGDGPQGPNSILSQEGFPAAALATVRKYLQFSPIARLARKSFGPVLWDRHTWLDEPDPRARELMQVASHFGLREGCLVPVRGPRGLKANVSLAGYRVRVPGDCVPVVHLVAWYGFIRLRELATIPAPPARDLTRRDRDVLAWSAHGKSTAEIAELMGIADRTVEEHVRHACRRLRAANRTQAVAIAVRDGLINIDSLDTTPVAR